MTVLAQAAGWVVLVFVAALEAVILFHLATGRIDLRRLISEPTGDASMSRFQFLIFTFVIAASLLVVILQKGDFPTTIPAGVFALLGISAGSYVVSKG